MFGVGFGHYLPELTEFNSEEETVTWFESHNVDKIIVQEVQKTNLASKLMSKLKL